MHELTNPPPETPSTNFFLDEDDNARLNIARHLRRLGYRVLVAAHLEDAIATDTDSVLRRASKGVYEREDSGGR